MLKYSIGSLVVAVLTGAYGFQQGIGETQPLMGLCRMVCVGFVFLTIEDETGLVNVIVRPDVYERNRRTIRSSQCLIVEGVLQKEQGCIDVIMKRCWPLDTHGTTEKVRARNFH